MYLIYGTQSVTYNAITYTTGQQFRGISGVATFTFSGSGTQLVYESMEIKGAAITYNENALDTSVFTENIILSGATIEFLQNANDIHFNDATIMNGFAIELIDYPFYSFQINCT